MFDFTIKTDLFKKIVEFEDLPNKVYKKIYPALIESVNDVRSDIINSMRDTKRAKWSYKRGKKRHFPSAPGSPPAIDTGGLIGRILMTAKITEVELGTNLKYGKWLEEGTKRRKGMKIRKIKTVRQAKFTMEPRPWLGPAIEKNEDKIKRNIFNAAKGAFK